MSSGIYDLDDSKSKVMLLRKILEAQTDIATLRELLDKHGIISKLEFDAAKNYISQLPEFNQMKQYLDQIENQINHYKANPQDHLRDIFNQKLQGKL